MKKFFFNKIMKDINLNLIELNLKDNFAYNPNFYNNKKNFFLPNIHFNNYFESYLYNNNEKKEIINLMNFNDKIIINKMVI
jgi:hypothetical protein